MITGDPAIKALFSRLGEAETPLAAHGLWGSAAPIAAALTAEHLARPILYLTAHLEQADDARDDMETILERAVRILPAWETLPGEGSGASEIGSERARLCGELHQQNRANLPDGRLRIVVAPIQAIIQPLPTPAALDANSLSLAVGQSYEPEKIASWLTDRGFERLDQVEQPGDFALRGGILDIFATADVDPVRLEFLGDEIESIRQFETGTQRSARELTSTRVTLPPDPAKALPIDTTMFMSYLPANTLMVLHEPVEIAEVARTVLDRLGNPVGHFSFEAIHKRLAHHGQLHLSRFPCASVPDKNTIALSCAALSSFDAKASDAVRQLLQLADTNPVIVYCDNQGEADRLRELIEQEQESGVGGEVVGDEDGIRFDGKESCDSHRLKTGATPRETGARLPRIETRIGSIHAGFRWGTKSGAAVEQESGEPSASAGGYRDRARRGVTVLPHHELFRRYSLRRRIRKVATSRPIESFLDLDDGDYVVHVVHGIARYVGMKTMRKGDSRKSEEFLTLRFADSKTLHVPVSQIDLVQKYVGAKAMRPPLSKLGGSRWQAMKDKVEQAVSDLASDLLRIQAFRESQPGIAYPRDTHWQKEFEAAFPYTETPDQITVVGDIKADQQRARPMDRLLCGDVGYGKTELAIRAAFKTVEFGKQVAILVPTTLLAEQHYQTMKERLADYPFLIACLNRFRSPRQQGEIIRATKKGQVDILVGTHRILSQDVGFSDLGLVVVDEEQRFGVEHKERLKHLRSTVDILTLTATPIPRTLHMAMVGLRDISSLATPPMDRRSISTRVCSWSDDEVRQAILRELNREGQVFFVHNRVHSIKGVAARLAALVPDARIVIGHGQMSSDELEDVMLRFVRHEADILVCTTIIEAGLDIPNANTIFIDGADRFGLADMHQLRGRVGRYKHRAYCYLLLSPDRPMTSTAAKRLKAIEEFSELGAGFRIAMRDLEIRGAGNILGPEQSGHIAAVGYELYCQLLEKNVRRMRGEPAQERAAVHLELDVEAYIPKAYIASDRQRMECYRRVTACRTPADVDQLTADLTDAFGTFPQTVETLLALAELRVRAAAVGIKTIIKREPDVIFHFDGEIRKIEPCFTHARGDISLPDAHTLYWRPPDEYFHGTTLLTVLRNLFRPRQVRAGPSEARVAGALPSPEQAGETKGRPVRAGSVRATPNALPADAPRKRRRGRSGDGSGPPR